MKRKYKILVFLIILLALLAWSIFIYYYSPEKFVELIGIENGYILTFVSAVIGGSSIFTTAFFFTTIATLGAGGLNPLLLGIIGGLGIGSGDLIFYFLGKKGRHALPHKLDKKIIPLEKKLIRHHAWTIPIIVFLYCSFTPLPNDILTAFLASVKVPLKTIIIPIILGNIVFITFLSYGVSFF